MPEDYAVTGSFAGNSISGFKDYVKDGMLDWEAARADWGLVDAQQPYLEAELKAAGYLGTKGDAPLEQPAEEG